MLKVSTYNLRQYLNRWNERFPLLVQTLIQADVDVVGFQEVSLDLAPKNQAQVIADAVNQILGAETYHVFFSEGRGGQKGREGIALMYRTSCLSTESIALPGIWRVAQLLRTEKDGHAVEIINTHLHHEPLDDEIVRFPQAEAVLNWAMSRKTPTILMGDFNAKPGTSTVELILSEYVSAYQNINHKEPEFTWPTRLLEGTPDIGQQKCIDYIFVKKEVLAVSACHLIGTLPDPEDACLYASDHFGMIAEVDLLPSGL